MLIESRGLALSRAYFLEIVQPLLAGCFPGLPYSAGRLGAGSDVWGLDDVISRDHDWGLRLSLFVPADRVDAVDIELARSLPVRFRHLPTRFTFTAQAAPRHHVEVSTVGDFLDARLGFDPREPISARNWLSLTGQAALEVTAGPLFADRTGEITAARAGLEWYPDDLWRHVIAVDWSRLGQELPLMSRAGDVGDDRGSRIIAGRLAQVTMHLAYLLSRRWPPYSKWLGVLFRELPVAEELGPAIDGLLRADDWRGREDALASSLQLLLEAQNDLGLTSIGQATMPFWHRPYRQPHPAIVRDLRGGIRDPAVQALPPGLGSIEQRTDVVEILTDVAERRRLALP